VFDEAAGDILEQGRDRVMIALSESATGDVVDRTVLEQTVRRTLGRYFYEVTQRKPVILPVIMEV
jgi:mRNA degradation ribonuclease J1/J2